MRVNGEAAKAWKVAFISLSFLCESSSFFSIYSVLATNITKGIEFVNRCRLWLHRNRKQNGRRSVRINAIISYREEKKKLLKWEICLSINNLFPVQQEALYTRFIARLDERAVLSLYILIVRGDCGSWSEKPISC